MSRLRGRGLEIDDPLGPGPSRQKQRAAVQTGAAQTLAARADERADRGADDATASGPLARSDDETTASANGRPAAGPQQPTDATEPIAGTDGRAWREWSGLTGVGSFRLPHELLSELSDTARELQLPVGLIVTAAITQLLEQPPDTISALVDRADDSRIQGRRRARRRLTTRSDD